MRRWVSRTFIVLTWGTFSGVTLRRLSPLKKRWVSELLGWTVIHSLTTLDVSLAMPLRFECSCHSERVLVRGRAKGTVLEKHGAAVKPSLEYYPCARRFELDHARKRAPTAVVSLRPGLLMSCSARAPKWAPRLGASTAYQVWAVATSAE